MVTILPPKTNVGSQIGAALGQGLQAGMQQGIQRGMLQNALKQVEQLGQKDEKGNYADPFKLATALMSATAGIPGAERYVGQLFPYLLTQLQNQQFQNIPAPGGGLPGIPGEGQPQQSTQISPASQQELSGQPSLSQAQNQLTQLKNNLPLPIPDPTLDLFGNAPEDVRYGSGPKPVTYSPEEYAQVERDYRQRNLDPAPAINFMQRNDEIARQRYNDILKGVDVEYNLQEKRAASQNRVRQTLTDQLGIKEPRLLAIADMLGRRKEFAAIPDEFRRAEAIRTELNNYVGTESAFKQSAQRYNPFFRHQDYEKQKKVIKTNAQRMIDYGQRNEVYKSLADNGWSETEIAQMLNPLSAEEKKKIDSIPHYTLARTEQQGRFAKNKSVIEQANKKIQSTLQDLIKPGKPDPKNPDVLKPGTSLILLKKSLMKKGMTSNEFDQELSKLLEDGKIQLDAEQARQLNLINEGPYRVESIYELVTGQ